MFIAYRDYPRRRAVLAGRCCPGEDYLLYGKPFFDSRGYVVRHNLERRLPHRVSRALRSVGSQLAKWRIPSGDWASVLGHLDLVNASDVVFSAADTVGVPLLILKYFGVVRPPIVYASIGLLERLPTWRAGGRSLAMRALSRAQSIVCYGYEESRRLGKIEGRCARPVHFLPFGVDTNAIRPPASPRREFDVLAMGADPQRDFGMVVDFAKQRADLRVVCVVSRRWAESLGEPPRNLSVIVEAPFGKAMELLGAARIVALPVKENAYSGATTTLLQSMAMAKPVVLTRTGAIAEGYHLKDGWNCRLVPANDRSAFRGALEELLLDPRQAARIGDEARRTVVAFLDWTAFAARLEKIVNDALTKERAK